MKTFDTFKFHLLLQNKTIPELEQLIKSGEYSFKVKRRGIYHIRSTPSREHSAGVYVDKNQNTWSIEGE